MAKIKYHSAEAVKELKALVQEFVNLNQTVNSTGKNSQLSLSKIEKGLLSIQNIGKKTVSAIEKINTASKATNAIAIKNKKAIEGSVNAMNKQIAVLRKAQSAKATNNESWLKYELRIKKVKNRLDLLRSTQSKVHLSIKKETNAVKRSTTANRSNTKSIKTKTSALKRLRNTFGLFLGIHFLKDVFLSVFNMTKNFDSLRFSMEKIVDTSFDLASSQRFLLRISEDYGVELLATSQRYVKFLAAAKQSNLSLNDTEKIFRSVTKAASVLGLKTDELTGVYLALEQMLSKGKVTTEELRRQLGERLPGAMGIMAAALDVTIPKLDEMLRKGEVLSADALPKFAKALEIAFGITQVERIDNLVAAQNRLANTWQSWIEDISKGENGLSSFFKSAINKVNNFIKVLSKATQSPDLQLRLMTIDKVIEAENSLRDQAIIALEISGTKIIDLTKDVENKQNEILTSSTTKRLDLINKSAKDKDLILNEELRLLIVNQTKQAELIEASEIKISKAKVSQALINYQDSKADYEKGIKLIKDGEAEIESIVSQVKRSGFGYNFKGKKVGQEYLDNLKATVKKEKSIIDARALDLATTEAYFDTFRKKIQESNVNVPEGSSSGDSKKQLKEIKDLQNKIDVERLQSSIQLNKLLLQSDETLIEDKKQLLLDISKYEIEIAKIQVKDTNDNNRIKYEKQLESLKKYLEDGKITQKEFDDQSVALLKEKNQNLELVDLEYNKRIKASKLKLGKDLIQVVEEQDSIEISRIKNKYNLELIAINEIYANSSRTAEDWKELERGKKNVAMKMANEIIDAQIAILEAQLLVKNQSKESIEQIVALINKLKASKKSLNPNKTDVISWQDWAEKVGEVINEVGNLVDAIYQRKIENINAEIAAEEKKYDKLIALAENDASKKAILEQERQNSLDKLEKKRLKEEQKAAKARKAFAVAEIIINTAVNISKVLYNPFLVALVASLGAIQLATVLAAPIPQYKDGIESVPNDQVAMINDGGKKEYVERDGQILSTNTKNAIVGLKKNDTVHKDYEAATKSSSYSIITKGEIVKQNEFDKLSKTIKSSIKEGFSKAKVSNVLKLNNNSGNSYLKQKARF
jgi:tape measure domain-containing protein